MSVVVVVVVVMIDSEIATMTKEALSRVRMVSAPNDDGGCERASGEKPEETVSDWLLSDAAGGDEGSGGGGEAFSNPN